VTRFWGSGDSTSKRILDVLESSLARRCLPKQTPGYSFRPAGQKLDSYALGTGGSSSDKRRQKCSGMTTVDRMKLETSAGRHRVMLNDALVEAPAADSDRHETADSIAAISLSVPSSRWVNLLLGVRDVNTKDAAAGRIARRRRRLLKWHVLTDCGSDKFTRPVVAIATRCIICDVGRRRKEGYRMDAGHSRPDLLTVARQLHHHRQQQQQQHCQTSHVVSCVADLRTSGASASKHLDTASVERRKSH